MLACVVAVVAEVLADEAEAAALVALVEAALAEAEAAEACVVAVEAEPDALVALLEALVAEVLAEEADDAALVADVEAAEALEAALVSAVSAAFSEAKAAVAEAAAAKARAVVAVIVESLEDSPVPPRPRNIPICSPCCGKGLYVTSLFQNKEAPCEGSLICFLSYDSHQNTSVCTKHFSAIQHVRSKQSSQILLFVLLL